MKNDYKSFAVDLAYKAGELMRENFDPGIKKQWKKDNTPVTEIDFAVNKLVLDQVKKKYPAHSILAEEESVMRDNAEYVWVCDPIDGTVPFSHGIPTYAFSLALVKDGEPILGVVYDPIQDRLLHGEKNKGTFLNKKKVKVSKLKSLNRSITILGVFPHSKYYLINVVNEVLKRGAFSFNYGSVVYAGMLIASGNVVAGTYASKYSHDVAALKILVEEAGGKVTSIFGKEQRYDGVIEGALMSNGLIHEEMLKIIKENVILR